MAADMTLAVNMSYCSAADCRCSNMSLTTRWRQTHKSRLGLSHFFLSSQLTCTPNKLLAIEYSFFFMLDQVSFLSSYFSFHNIFYYVFLSSCSLIGGSDYKLIYRHYATLYFVFCVDSSESELGILDLIQVSYCFSKWISYIYLIFK